MESLNINETKEINIPNQYLPEYVQPELADNGVEHSRISIISDQHGMVQSSH